MIWSSNKYVATAVISLSIWLVANILNALLFAILITAGGPGDEPGIVGFVMLCSALFSLPGLVFFWVLFISNCRKPGLFQLLLITSAAVSFLSVMFFFLYLAISFGADSGMWMIILPVIAAVAATVVHRKAIENVMITQNEKYPSKNSYSLET